MMMSGGLPEINKICPAITPTLGAELWDAGASTFESGVYNWTPYGTNTVENDANTLKITYVNNVSGAYDYLKDDADLSTDLTVDTLYLLSIDTKVNAGSSVNVDVFDGVAVFVIRVEIGAAGFTTTPAVFRAKHAQNCYVRISGFAAGEIAWVDNLSLKAVTATDVLLGTLSHQAGTYICHPSVAENSAVGFKILYKDASNFVLAIVNRLGTDQVQLYTVTAGVWAAVAAPTGNIVYGAAQELKAIVQVDGKIDLSYNGVAVGAQGALTLANFGKAVYGYNNYAGNTVGAVTTNP